MARGSRPRRRACRCGVAGHPRTARARGLRARGTGRRRRDERAPARTDRRGRGRPTCDPPLAVRVDRSTGAAGPRLLRGGDRELLFAIPLLFVWAQLHGSYALGLGLILASCAARAIEEKPERWRFVPIASFAVLVTLLGPSGLDAWTSSGGHFLAPPRFIAEEGAPDARTLPGAFFLITLALVIATASLGRRATLRETLVLVPVALVALTATRHTPLLAIA